MFWALAHSLVCISFFFYYYYYSGLLHILFDNIFLISNLQLHITIYKHRIWLSYSWIYDRRCATSYPHTSEDLSSNPMIFLKDAETDKLRFHTVCTEPCFLVCRCCKAATERGNNQLKTTSSSSTATKCSFISPTCSRSLLFTDLIGTRVA